MFASRHLISRRPWICLRSTHSAASPPGASGPDLLLKVRNDMKTAMKAKDKERLDVLRGLISEVNNAAKTSKPVATDSQMIGVIRKRIKISEAAAFEFKAANRQDLEAQESAQLAVLNEYLEDSKSLGEDDITAAAQMVIGRMRMENQNINRGNVMKALVGPGGSLEGQTVDKTEVARLIGGMV